MKSTTLETKNQSINKIESFKLSNSAKWNTKRRYAL